MNCPNCGQQISEETVNQSEYKPISMWGYFGYELLFSIPFVGFILLLVFSFGGSSNKNLRNFARSYLCYVIIAFVIMALLAAIITPAMLSYMEKARGM